MFDILNGLCYKIGISPLFLWGQGAGGSDRLPSNRVNARQISHRFRMAIVGLDPIYIGHCETMGLVR